jgi:hypothetical protein
MARLQTIDYFIVGFLESRILSHLFSSVQFSSVSFSIPVDSPCAIILEEAHLHFRPHLCLLNGYQFVTCKFSKCAENGPKGVTTSLYQCPESYHIMRRALVHLTAADLYQYTGAYYIVLPASFILEDVHVAVMCCAEVARSEGGGL